MTRVALQTGDEIDRLVRAIQTPLVEASIVIAIGLVTGYLLGAGIERLLTRVGFPDVVEGTAFERTARSLGTSTVSLIARLVAGFVYGAAVLQAVTTLELVQTEVYRVWLTGFVPRLLIAVVVVIVGFVIADRGELLVSERLRSVKLPEVDLLPRVVKYSILYVVGLVALSQIGVDTAALLVLLAVYAFALVVFGGLAARSFLSAGAAGVYLLLRQPYGIGDEIRVGDRQGIVQEMDLFVTRVENEGAEYLIPNQIVLEEGVARIRE
ncbi:mechanosensitive ion channel protein MscS [Halobacteriales archaeon SW_7_68_16]|nr:MAG: mechanosensitive ion channel protein MscS [Halobacteriales archaeon SW_7_68_16]